MIRRKRAIKKSLYEALEMCMVQELALLPEKEELKNIHIFSNEFRRQMREIAGESDSRQKKFVFIGKRAYYKVALLLILLAALLIGSATVSAAIHYYKMHLKFDGDMSLMDYDITEEEYEELPAVIEDFYEPEYIPEGYDRNVVTDVGAIYGVNYVKDKPDYISFLQMVIKDNNCFINVEEGVEVKNIMINETPGIFYANRGVNNIVWNDKYYQYIVLSETLNYDELLKISESVKKIK